MYCRSINGAQGSDRNKISKKNPPQKSRLFWESKTKPDQTEGEVASVRMQGLSFRRTVLHSGEWLRRRVKANRYCVRMDFPAGYRLHNSHGLFLRFFTRTLER